MSIDSIVFEEDLGDTLTQGEIVKILAGESIDLPEYWDKLGALYDAQERGNSNQRTHVLCDGKDYTGYVTYVDSRSDRFVVEIPGEFSSGYLDINKVEWVTPIKRILDDYKDVKIWMDPFKPVPKGYVQTKSVFETLDLIEHVEYSGGNIALIDLEYELGEYARNGGVGSKLLKTFIARETFYPVRVHTNNPVARESMKSLIKQYWPEERING